MVIATPRCGTAWASNWLTTDTQACLHDPLWDYHYSDLDALQFGSKDVGIACTGLALFPDWENAHPAKKVILHRPLNEVNASCEALGVPHVPVQLFENLHAIKGLHLNWQALFNRPQVIHDFLFEGTAFDWQRHNLLRRLNITAKPGTRVQNQQVMQRLLREAHGIPS